jgi:copper(I)-binding protein
MSMHLAKPIARPLAAFLVATTFLGGGQALGHGYKAGTLQISHPWTRATPAGAKVAGGYLVITNKGAVADRLKGGSTEAGTRIEVHEMAESEGVMRMRKLAEGLAIPPGATVELKPAGYHLMILGLKQPLVEGEMVKATLLFEKAGPVEIELEVSAMGTTPSPHEDDDGAHTH